MSGKCVHKGCGKVFSDPEEPCVYHPGAPVFHEGQKGWKCCKPRVLTFDEFLSIPPCTTGKHSTVDDTPAPEPKPTPEIDTTQLKPADEPKTVPRVPIAPQAQAPAPTPAQEPLAETSEDDTKLTIPTNTTCRRRGCNATYKGGSREGEKCIYHPGAPLFHEGSKGYTCCKRRVLEFDQFLKMEGCKEKSRHLFMGSGGNRKRQAASNDSMSTIHPNDEASTTTGNGSTPIDPTTIRTDFYQTPTTLVASLFLKQIDASKSSITFETSSEEQQPPKSRILLSLETKDNRLYSTPVNLWGPIDASKSRYKILGTKVEFELVKDVEVIGGNSWPALREGERGTGEIIQSGRAGRV